MAKGEGRILLTPTFRMIFPALAQARQYTEKGQAKGDPKYGVGMILDPDDFGEFKEADGDELSEVNIKKVLLEVAEQEWSDKLDDIKTAIKSGGIHWPLRKGETWVKEKDNRSKYEDVLAGKYLVNADTKEDYRPALKAIIDGKVTQLTPGLTEDDKRIKSLFVGGNYAFAEVNVKGLDVSGNKYLKFYLNAVCFVKPGERIGGAGGLMDRFDGIAGGEADVDPTEGDDLPDDEIPF